MADADGLTDEQILASGYVIDDCGTEASDGHTWLFLCGRCWRWSNHVNHEHGHEIPRPLCDNCLRELNPCPPPGEPR
jgi:hypothetical protein